MKQPDSELYGYVTRLQAGDAEAGWLFTEHKKIQAIIRGRIRQYRSMFSWLPDEDFEDVAHGLRPRLIEIAKQFVLPEQPNDGRIISYFSMRIRGEADYLLKTTTNMVQKVDKETEKPYLCSLSQPLDDVHENIASETKVDVDVINRIESGRQSMLFERVVECIPDGSNDHLWLRCYRARLAGFTWAQVSSSANYRSTDYAWLKDNTARFVTRLKDGLIRVGEDVSYRICGIYADAGEVAIAIWDSEDPKNCMIWSRGYDTYGDLQKIEDKLGDVFRQYEVTYVVMNEQMVESRANVIIMRYLSKKESFVEFVELRPFIRLIPTMPKSVNGVVSNNFHRHALLLANIKRAQLDELRQRTHS